MKVARQSKRDVLCADEWYESVPELAMAHLDCDRAGVSLRGPRGTVITLAASDGVVEESDRLQEQHADGPVVSPAWGATQVAVTEAAGHGPWPVWASAIGELGIRGVLATQIVTPEGPTGALTLYYSTPVDVTAHELALARALAQHVASEVHHAIDAAQMAAAAQARTRIGQAQGMLMERFALSAEEAFEVLERHAQDTHTRLRDVAERVFASRDLVGHPISERHR